MSNTEHEAALAALLEQNELARIWFAQMRGWAKDGTGRTILLGLSADETLEFFRLDLVVNGDKLFGDADRRGEPEFEAICDRYYALKEKHDTAARQDALENLDYLNRGTPKN